MSFQKYEQKPTTEDKYGLWTIGKDGRHFFNYVDAINGKVKINLGLLNKTTDALKNNFPETDNPDEQESQNAYFYDGETFSISQFKGLTLIYKGAAKYPSKVPATLPGVEVSSKSQTGGSQTTFSKGNWKSGSGGGRNWPPSKPGIFLGLQVPEKVSMEEANKRCALGSDYVLPPENMYSVEFSEGDGKPLYKIGVPKMG